jgi:hypothetical protein
MPRCLRPAASRQHPCTRILAGEVSPAAAFDTLSSSGSAVLIDIRSAKEKESAGLPDLPGGGGKLVEL